MKFFKNITYSEPISNHKIYHATLSTGFFFNSLQEEMLQGRNSYNEVTVTWTASICYNKIQSTVGHLITTALKIFDASQCSDLHVKKQLL